MNAQEIIKNLKIGNERFINKNTVSRAVNPLDLADGQSPQAIILTCADSRVPPELIFDKDLGELFVIRVAGNTATDEVVGSIEYAAANLGSKLCVVLGHSACGAVSAAVDHHTTGNDLPTTCLQKVIDPILPAVKRASEYSGEDFLSDSVRFNILNSISQIKIKSPLLLDFESKGQIVFAGAEYDLASGKVTFSEE